MTHHTLRLFPWFAYQGRKSLEQLKQHADALDGISIFGEKDPSREFLAFCRKRGIATLKLVAGDASKLGDASHFDTPARARATVRRLLRMCAKTGYGGIDLDYEHIPHELNGRYAAFMRELSAGLRDAGRRMSICVHGLTRGEHGRPASFDFYDPETIAATCDEVRPMCYDYFFAYDGITGPTTAWLWAREVMEFWLQYIPREKMFMALPAYGNDFPSLPDSGKGKQVDYEHPSAVGAKKIEHAWLHRERLNFYRYLDAEDKPRVLFATDGDSTRELLKIVDEFRIPAISFWYYQTMRQGIWKALADSGRVRARPG